MQTLQLAILFTLFLLTVWLFFLNSRANHPSWAAPDKSSGQRVQNVHISLACIGFLPESIIAEMLTHASKSRTA